MLGQDVNILAKDFQPYLPDHREGYLELDQIRPGVVICPFCDSLIDARQSDLVKQIKDVIDFYQGQTWASIPICTCPGVWVVWDPNHGKFAFRYQIPGKGSYDD